MTVDRRLTPATSRAAHVSLRGHVDAPVFTAGEPLSVTIALVDLLRAPGGARERQLWLGDGFTVIDRDGGYAYGFAHKDGFCGWLPETALGLTPEPTHWVSGLGTHVYPEPRVQARETMAVSMGARIAVTVQTGKWAETAYGYLPASHLRAIGAWETDLVAVAERFVGTPYLWGGNSRAGIDCSGLVQVSFLSCGRDCPGDSDLQEVLGQEITPDEPLRRGDLLFWAGHVALVTDTERLIHANGHSMSVKYENIADCMARVASQGGGAVTHRRRP